MKALRYAIPNLFTGLSFCLGLWSLQASHAGDLELAGWLIVWCALLDMVDGAAARLLNAASRFGAEFDSFADLLAFGVAPCALAFAAGEQLFAIEADSLTDRLLAAACVFFALASALRLARFNVATPERQALWFRGIPTTLAGSIVATSLIVAAREPQGATADWGGIMSGVLVTLGLAMISLLQFPKVAVRQNRATNAFQAAILATIYICGILRLAPEYLLGVSVSFAALGILIGLLAADTDR
jgi:CDP-diacylglycerol--serine O-phosphatidyltransferase